MYMFVIETLQKSKYHYPAPSWHTLGAALGIHKLFFKGYNCPVLGQGKCSKCELDNATLWAKPVLVKGNCS